MSRWTVEQTGIDWITDAERHGTPRRQFWPWAAANLGIYGVTTGVYVVALGLGWWQALIAITLGVLLSYPLLGLVAVAGTKGGAPTMVLSRAAFGVHGNALPGALNYLALIGWETLAVTLGALSARTVLTRLGVNAGLSLVLGFVLVTGASVVLGVYGLHVITRVHRWITVALAVMTAGYLAMVLPGVDPANLPTGGGATAILSGVALVAAATGLGWITGGADYSRYLPRTSSPRAVAGWTALGGALAPLVLMTAGVLLSADPELAATAATDPIGALADRLPTWFLLPFLTAVLLSLVASGTLGVYSSGLALQALGVRIRRPLTVVVDAVLVVAFGSYVVFRAPDFLGPWQAFLSALGTVAAAWSAIFVADLLLHRRDGYSAPDLTNPDGGYGRVNPAGTSALVAATIAGHFLGAATAFLVAAALYTALTTTVLRPRRPVTPAGPTAPAG
ncbi:purine-cytosine permease-like protein [Saccharothrix tamanrassetensis]|uniref:Purine-cytosine permease-like protein n=1 Tax=Saccharothrix tamanrassetensis TaxID=1051531 RepID=A0A841CRS7_9PSEU|nr:cytosine permease [Saccharothrix tamanrassetensis]MBB5958737.1 purine-cytosine permease-like protein [Saccharothrix tamanrassetensis]